MKNICEKHGEYDFESIVIFGKEFKTNCPICNKEQEEALAEEQKEKQQLYKMKSLMARGIEPEYFGAIVQNYKVENETEQQAKNSSLEILNGNLKKMLLLGSNGVGKTYLACALAQQLNGVRITMFELSAKIRAGYNNGQSEIEILDNLLNFGFIAIDEVGRTKGSDAERNWLSYLIDKAHTRKIPLMLISNRHTARNLPAERRGEAIEYFFDNDVISRLRQNSRIVEINGRDRRATLSSV